MEVASAANNAAWNCEQGKNGEWTCLNQGQPSQEAAQPKVIAPQTPETARQTKPPVAGEPAAAATARSAPTPEQAPRQEPSIQTAEQPGSQKVAAPEQPAPQKLRARIAENQQAVVEKIPPRSEPAAKTAKAAKTPGWSCQSGDEKANWNCNLVGRDPKGEAQVAAEAEQSSTWLTPTFNSQQERTFQVLRGEFDQDPWQNCSTWSAKKRPIKATPSEVRDSANTDVTADFSEIYEGEILNFAGNVDLTRADQHMLADKASYDTVADTMDAQGNVIYSEDTLALSSDTASLSLGKDEARLRKAQFIAAEAPLRGTADVMYRDSKSLSRYHQATFTSCPPGNQDWIAHASRVKINRESGLGSAKHAWLEFKGVPFLYTPYISFPVDNRRTSGLLAPAFGNTQRNGFDVTAPFYWNIAPNYDDIITPRYMANRGGMLRNKFRYLTESSNGSLGTEFLPYDQLKDKSRYSATFKDNRNYAPGLSSIVDLNYVSDKEYFNDMNNALGFQTNSFLPSTAYLYYGGIPGVGMSTGINHYQSVDKTIPKAGMPYDILPRADLTLGHNFEHLPVNLAMYNQFSHFYHSELVNGQRFNLAPSVSLPLEASAGFFIPKITAQYTQYQLSNLTVPNQDSSVSRTLPIFSVDSGMMFEKDINIGGSGYTHTLEPRAFYLYIPRKDQSDIPIFDTAAYDTNFYSLFRENRFSGYDRIQDANQITLAGTSRFIDAKTGLEPLKVSLGQIIYFQDRTVDLDYLNDNRAVENSRTSNFVGEVSGQITKHLSYSTGAQWDPITNGFARTQAILKYRNQPDQIFDVGYRWRNYNPNDIFQGTTTDISQSDVSFRWPLAAGWYGLGRWQYSFNFSATTESFIGFEKETCCWRLRVIGRRYINGANNTNILSPDAKPENAVFVQLELKGLTSFGDSVDQFLKENLNGYRPADYFED
ncbi:LPS-assembly protein LptD [Methylomonas sp. LL1]|uniref:LPS-assembly protein LptD n=1 Tax=Methylomonas sp. LL1 TaxID=2785785 RepID=UPI001E5C1826|nr:LPS assembly protein LptD [Methylomonas sp. LL1]